MALAVARCDGSEAVTVDEMKVVGSVGSGYVERVVASMVVAVELVLGVFVPMRVTRVNEYDVVTVLAWGPDVTLVDRLVE